MYNMQNVETFPLVTHNIDYNSYFQENIAYLYFNLTKKNDVQKTLKLGSLYKQVLDSFKKQCPNNPEYLELLYRMVGECRDIFGGKGEHDLSYCLLMNLYDIYPNLAIYALHRFVQPTKTEPIVYGSWRDIKYFCEFLRLYSKKNENHPLIDVCVELMNSQLYKDLHSWKFSIHAFSREHISFVSKWIPRENKKFHWLFIKLCSHWANKHKSYLLKTTNFESFIKALTKAKKIYRKNVSLLNKGLDTTEIKQCSQQLYNIIPAHVSSGTTMKQNNLVFATSLLTKNNLFDRIKCSQLFQNYFFSFFDKSISSNKHKLPNYYKISHFVKEALRLKNSINNNEIYVLNKQWECFSKTHEFFKLENIIPMLDVSFDMQSNRESFYTAIGISLFIAENSKYGKRILAMDNIPTWIIIDPSANFICNIENIFNSIKSMENTCLNVKKAFDLLSMGFMQTECSYGYIHFMKLLFISSFSNNNNNPISVYNDYKTAFTMNKTYPNIMFWNLNQENIIDLPADIPCISGTSYFLLPNIKNNSSQYDFVVDILKNSRYDVLGNYLQELVETL